MKFRHAGLFMATLAMGSVTPVSAARVGDMATSSVYHLDNGQILDGEQLRGMVVVLNYWGQECRACDEQLKALDYYYRQRKSLGLVVMAASSDAGYISNLRAALKGYRVHAVTGVNGELQPLNGIPTTYIIDRTGKVRYAKAGAIGLDKLNELLIPIIREPQP